MLQEPVSAMVDFLLELNGRPACAHMLITQYPHAKLEICKSHMLAKEKNKAFIYRGCVNIADEFHTRINIR